MNNHTILPFTAETFEETWALLSTTPEAVLKATESLVAPDPETQAATQLLRGAALSRLGRFTLSEGELSSALDGYTKIGSREILHLRTLAELAWCLALRGESERAADLFQQHADLAAVILARDTVRTDLRLKLSPELEFTSRVATLNQANINQRNMSIRQYSGLMDAIKLISEDGPLEDLLPILAEIAARTMGAQGGWVTLLAPGEADANTHFTFGLPDSVNQTYPIHGSPDGRMIRENSLVRVSLQAEEGTGAYSSTGMVQLAGMALRANEQIYGTLKVLFSDSQVEPSQNILNSLAQLTATAIHTRVLILDKQKLSITDPLTGLLNQSYFLEIAQAEMRRARRYHHTFSLIMVDLDHFREINEAYGYHVGDEVLRNVGKTLKSFLRDVDVVARYGGEEFVILLPETNLQDALGVAGRMLYNLRATQIETPAGSFSITASIGVSGLAADGNEETSLDRLLEQSDKALYQSKKNGRNRVTVWLED